MLSPRDLHSSDHAHPHAPVRQPSWDHTVPRPEITWSIGYPLLYHHNPHIDWATGSILWSSSCHQVFLRQITAPLTSAPILLVPHPDRQFVVEVDASDVGLEVSSPNAQLRPRNCTPAPSSHDVCRQLRETMTLRTENCWRWSWR